jgi:hypothetical protein
LSERVAAAAESSIAEHKEYVFGNNLNGEWKNLSIHSEIEKIFTESGE